MALSRTVVCGLITLLVVGTFLSFATSDAAMHVFDKHPRHAGGQSIHPPRVTWKTTPGIIALRQPPIVLSFFRQASIQDPARKPSTILRPPFVPPRA